MKKIKLIAFDGDGTAWHYSAGNFGSSWDAVFEAVGKYPQAQKLLNHYYPKKDLHAEWTMKEAALLTGESVALVESRVLPIPYTPGFREFAESLRGRVRRGLLTNGLDVVARKAEQELDLDFCFCNTLHRNNGNYSGTISYDVPLWSKHCLFEKLCEGMDREEVVYVGDTKGDIPCMQIAGLGVAFDPKEESVAESADVVIHDFRELNKILDFS